MHWKWLTCPVAWAGTYKGKADGPTLVLEAVCDKRLRVLHWNFGRPGANNDLNILHKSHLLDDFIAYFDFIVCISMAHGKNFSNDEDVALCKAFIKTQDARDVLMNALQ